MTTTLDYLFSIRNSLDRIEQAANVDERPRFEMAWRQADTLCARLAEWVEAGRELMETK